MDVFMLFLYFPVLLILLFYNDNSILTVEMWYKSNKFIKKKEELNKVLKNVLWKSKTEVENSLSATLVMSNKIRITYASKKARKKIVLVS